MRHTLYTGQGNGTDTGNETGQDQGLYIHSFFVLMTCFFSFHLCRSPREKSDKHKDKDKKPESVEGNEEETMKRMMGFSNFDSTKVSIHPIHTVVRLH